MDRRKKKLFRLVQSILTLALAINDLRRSTRASEWMVALQMLQCALGGILPRVVDVSDLVGKLSPDTHYKHRWSLASYGHHGCPGCSSA